MNDNKTGAVPEKAQCKLSRPKYLQSMNIMIVQRSISRLKAVLSIGTFLIVVTSCDFLQKPPALEGGWVVSSMVIGDSDYVDCLNFNAISFNDTLINLPETDKNCRSIINVSQDCKYTLNKNYNEIDIKAGDGSVFQGKFAIDIRFNDSIQQKVLIMQNGKVRLKCFQKLIAI